MPLQRVAVRISRFEDQAAFRRAVDLLSELYPERDPAEFEVGLARLPCLVSHDAEPRAADALKAALEALGASVRLLAERPAPRPATSASAPEVSRTMALSPQIDSAFLERAAAARRRDSEGRAIGPVGVVPKPASARAEPTADSAAASGEWTGGKAPWER